MSVSVCVCECVCECVSVSDTSVCVCARVLGALVLARTRALWCRCCTLLCCRSLTFFRVGALSEVASKSDAFRTRRLS